MSGNSKRRPVNVGGASLFAVLIILCLTAFAVLALLTARSELALTERAAEATTAFYEAEYRAVVRVTEIETEFQNKPFIYSIGETITFVEEIDQNRELKVTLRVTENGLVREEWAAARKYEAQEQEEAPKPGVMVFE